MKRKKKANKTKKLHYKSNQCSPFHKDKLPYTCMSKKSLHTMGKVINKLPGANINLTIDDKELYKQICEFIESNYNCDNEGCWLTIEELMKLIDPKELDTIHDEYRAKLPQDLVKDYTSWLSNFDIEEVLNKHHNNIEDFYFYGANPIDFRKCSVSQDLCDINTKKLRENGYNKLGMVFNTDESDEPGKHWMAMYVDLSGINLDGQPGIYFFDSFGTSPLKEIKQLIKKIKKTDKEQDYFVSHNDRPIQKNTYACGFYCMHFIEHMLWGLPFKKYLRSGLNDKKMKQYINECYLNPK
tara:strand:+ start:95 stop:985 length:891 start_codon:yes stop_codon:yes gene_type:complete